MESLVKLHYFKITRCGFYKFGEDVPAFGSIAETLADLKMWIAPKTLRQTKTFDPTDDQNLFPVYVSDLKIDSKTGDAVLVTWNETPSTMEGKVASAAGDDRVGSVGVDLIDVPPGGIPGFPCYFYFIPEKSVVVSIRFEGQIHGGQPGAARYISEFLSKFSSRVIVKENDEGVDITAYMDDEKNAPKSVRPFYRTLQVKIPGEVEWLKKNCDKIRKFVRRDQLRTGVVEDRAKVGSVWNWFGVTTPKVPQSGVVKFNFEIDCSIDESDFTALVDFDAQEHHKETDIGFRLAGESSVIHWLSHCLVKQELSVNVARSKAGTVSAEELLNVLSSKRDIVLSIIPDE